MTATAPEVTTLEQSSSHTHTSLGAAWIDAQQTDLDRRGPQDTAQEVGTSIGTALIGTMIAALVTTGLPAGTWSSSLVASFFRGERITYAIVAVIVGLVAGGGALTLTNSHFTKEHV